MYNCVTYKILEKNKCNFFPSYSFGRLKYTHIRVFQNNINRIYKVYFIYKPYYLIVLQFLILCIMSNQLIQGNISQFLFFTFFLIKAQRWILKTILCHWMYKKLKMKNEEYCYSVHYLNVFIIKELGDFLAKQKTKIT